MQWMHLLLSNTAEQCMQQLQAIQATSYIPIQQETNPMSVTRDLPRSIWGVEGKGRGEEIGEGWLPLETGRYGIGTY